MSRNPKSRNPKPPGSRHHVDQPDEQWSHHREIARRRAETVLRQIVRDKAEIEARHAELGLIDPIVEVTGLSSLDHAIASVREMIENLDADSGTIQCGVIARIPLTHVQPGLRGNNTSGPAPSGPASPGPASPSIIPLRSQ